MAVEHWNVPEAVEELNLKSQLNLNFSWNVKSTCSWCLLFGTAHLCVWAFPNLPAATSGTLTALKVVSSLLNGVQISHIS